MTLGVWSYSGRFLLLLPFRDPLLHGVGVDPDAVGDVLDVLPEVEKPEGVFLSVGPVLVVQYTLLSFALGFFLYAPQSQYAARMNPV